MLTLLSRDNNMIIDLPYIFKNIYIYIKDNEIHILCIPLHKLYNWGYCVWKITQYFIQPPVVKYSIKFDRQLGERLISAELLISQYKSGLHVLFLVNV